MARFLRERVTILAAPSRKAWGADIPVRTDTPNLRADKNVRALMPAEACSQPASQAVDGGADTAFPVMIEQMWQRQIASPQGFEAVYVAALRAAGVPARLNNQGRAEFWTGSEWRPAPRLLMEEIGENQPLALNHFPLRVARP